MTPEQVFSQFVELIAERVAAKLKGSTSTERVIMSTKQAAAYMHRSPNTVRELIESGQLPAIKLGRNIQILKEDVDEWLTRSRT